MKIATLAHALCSIGNVLAGSGIHSQIYLPEGMPLRWIQLGNNFGIGCFILGVVLKSGGHILLWIASILDKPIQVSEATVNTANLTLVTQER